MQSSGETVKHLHAKKLLQVCSDAIGKFESSDAGVR